MERTHSLNLYKAFVFNHLQPQCDFLMEQQMFASGNILIRVHKVLGVEHDPDDRLHKQIRVEQSIRREFDLDEHKGSFPGMYKHAYNFVDKLVSDFAYFTNCQDRYSPDSRAVNTYEMDYDDVGNRYPDPAHINPDNYAPDEVQAVMLLFGWDVEPSTVVYRHLTSLDAHSFIKRRRKNRR